MELHEVPKSEEMLKGLGCGWLKEPGCGLGVDIALTRNCPDVDIVTMTLDAESASLSDFDKHHDAPNEEEMKIQFVGPDTDTAAIY